MTAINTFDPRDVPAGHSNEVLAYWESVRGAALAPAWGRHFRLDDLAWDVLPNMSVVDVIDGGKAFRYRFWGTNNAARKGFEMTNKYLADWPTGTVAEVGRLQFQEVLRARRPLAMVYVGVYADHMPNNQISYRFPLSSDGKTIDKIATYQDFHQHPEDWDRLFDSLWAGQRPDWLPQAGH